jgi:hypothetical protein
VSRGNFANLTVGLLARKDEAELSPAMVSDALLVCKGGAKPSPMMVSETSRFAQHVDPAPAAACTESDVPARPRRTFVLSANEYKALGLVADKKGTTPQHLLRKMLRGFLVEFFERGDGSRR